MDDKQSRRKSDNGGYLTGSVLVEIWNPINKNSDWIAGVVRGYIPGDLHEDFERINITLCSGIDINGCHPDCVKQHEKQTRR